MKYRVGDRVRILKANISGKAVFVGLTSIITKVNPNGKRYTDIYGEHYSLDISRRFVFHTDEIKVISKKIVITTDGNETLARLYEGNKVIKSATAKCSPDDKFDAIVGAKLAFDRLVGEEKKREYKEEPKIKVGDKVVVANSGQRYSIYVDWFAANAPDLAPFYSYNAGPEDGTIGIVKRIAPHTKEETEMLYAIECGIRKTIYLLNEKGIKKVEG